MHASPTHAMRHRLLVLLCGVGSTALLGACDGDKSTGAPDSPNPDAADIIAAWEAQGYLVSCYPEGDSYVDDNPDGRCPEQSELEDGCCNPAVDEAVLTVDGDCCFPTDAGGCCGRPLYVDGSARQAPLVGRADWLHPEVPDTAALEPAARAVLAAAWAAEARLEHASVASFARFTLDLLAFGAPPALVLDTQRAAADEVAHAQRCFALASAYGGTPVGPGALPVGGVRPAASLAEAAAAAVAEACVGETVAAVEAAARAASATDPAVQHTLQRIAEDEARHAELGWRFVAWALQQGDPAVRPAVQAAFQAALAAPAPALAAGPDPLPPAILRAHGRLPCAEQATLRARIVADVLRTCSAVLLQPFPTQAADASPATAQA